MARATRRGVLAVFAHLDDLIGAMEALEREGRRDVTVFSPVPRHEIAHAARRPPSPTRRFTAVGGVAGATTGAVLAIWTSLTWPELVTDGKPIVSLPPYMIIVFECTILFGVLATLAALVVYAVGPGLWEPAVPSDPRFSIDRFGIFVPGDHDASVALGEKLRALGAEEVRVDA